MHTIWAVVANNYTARIYAIQGKEFQKIEELLHPAGRQKSREILSDKPGRSFQRGNVTRHAVGKEETAHEREREKFAREIIEYLRKGQEEKRFEKFALIAPAHLIGDMRLQTKKLAALQNALWKEVSKDLPEFMSEAEMKAHIVSYLELSSFQAPEG